MFDLGTVVVADASGVARQLLGVCFARVAKSVRAAANAEEALAQLADAGPRALLVAEAELPPHGALALYAQCAGLAAAPALIVTARRHDAQLAERALAAGALGVVAKPVKFRELFQLLRERDGTARRIARRVHPGALAYVLALEPDATTPIARWEVYDISASGALLATHGALRVGAELTLAVVIGRRQLPVQARVVRVQPPSCTAVRFLDAAPQMQAALDELEARVADWRTTAAE
jgi:CheY-like chemotaxis protein